MCTPALSPCLALHLAVVAGHPAEFIAAIKDVMNGQ
jgi:hypothetical protein